MKTNRAVGLSVLAAVLVAGLLVTSCASSPAKTELPSIKIGANLPLTGSLASTGREIKAGVQSAVDYLNSSGGIDGRKIDAVFEDDQYNTANTLTAVKKMVERDKIIALVSPHGTGNVIGLLPYLAEKKLVAVGPIGSDPQITKSPWAFATMADYDLQLYAAVKYAVKQHSSEKLHIGYLGFDVAAGQSALQGVNAAAKESGIEVTAISIPPTQADVTSELMKLKAVGTTDLVMLLGLDGFASSLNTAASIGWKPRAYGHIGGHAQKIVDLSKENAEGFYAVTFLAMKPKGETPTTQWKTLSDLLAKNFSDVSAGGLGGISWANTMILAQALKSAGAGQQDAQPEQIVKGLESLKNFDTGVIWPVTFTPTDHNGSKQVTLVQVQKGEWIGASGAINR